MRYKVTQIHGYNHIEMFFETSMMAMKFATTVIDNTDDVEVRISIIKDDEEELPFL